MLKFAFRNLLSRPMRSLLSLLGLTVAIVGMVSLFSVAEGLDATVSETFDQIPGLVVMQPGAPIPLFSRIPAEWETELAEMKGVRVVCPEIIERANLINGQVVVSPPRLLLGVKIDARRRLKKAVYREAVVEGRYLQAGDEGTNRTVISRQISEEYHAGIGGTLSIGGEPLEVVGIYHCGSLLLDVVIICDIDFVRRITRFDPDSVCAFYIEQSGEVPDAELAESIRTRFADRDLSPWRTSALMRADENPLENLFRWIDRSVKSAPEKKGARKNGAAPTDAQSNTDVRTQTSASTRDATANSDNPPLRKSPPLEVRSAEEWGEKIDEFSADLDLFLILITAIGVVIAVLSIVNTMLMSVSERIVEFGILKANGWSRFDVLRLITFESGIIGVAGGVFGSVLGWAVTLIANAQWPTRLNLFASPQLLLFAVLFSTTLGVLGGLYPAIWAMRMTPMDAIRRG